MADKLAKVCAELQALQRSRAAIIKSRIMAANNRRAFVANTLGYSAGLDEPERKKLFAEADDIIDRIVAEEIDHPTRRFVMAAQMGIENFESAQKETEKEMLPLAKKTPAAEWALLPEQRGFGLLSLATVVGEAGDLRAYSNPSKLWKRLGCAPWSFGGRTQMGSTWKSKGGLPAEEWSAFGYSPRRRSIAYVIGECLLKLNLLKTAGVGDSKSDTDFEAARPGTKKPRGGERRLATEVPSAAAGASNGSGVSDREVATELLHVTPGPYRLRYDLAKAACAAVHPDYPKLRCHRHAMLLATKLLLKNLWKTWNPAIDRGEWSPALTTASA